MPLYLSKFSYTPETWATLIGNPEDRREAAQSYIESVGGKLHGFWYAFGAHDGYTLWEPRQRVHGRGCAGDQWRRCAQLARNDGPPDRPTKRWMRCARPRKSGTKRRARSGSHTPGPLSSRTREAAGEHG